MRLLAGSLRARFLRGLAREQNGSGSRDENRQKQDTHAAAEHRKKLCRKSAQHKAHTDAPEHNVVLLALGHDDGEEHPIEHDRKAVHRPHGKNVSRQRAKERPEAPAGKRCAHGPDKVPDVEQTLLRDCDAEDLIRHIEADEHPNAERRIRGKLLAERAAHKHVSGVDDERHEDHHPHTGVFRDDRDAAVFSSGGVIEKAQELTERLKKIVRVKNDLTDKNPGWKFSEYEMKGVPLRLEIGPKDIEKNQCVLVRRDTGEKTFVSLDNLEESVTKLLDDIQNNLSNKALENRKNKTYTAKNMDEFTKILDEHPGFIKAMWCGDRACEDKIKEETTATSRCMPFEDQEHIADTCVCCGKPAHKLVYWGKAY